MLTGGFSAPFAFVLGVVMAYGWFFLQWPPSTLTLFCLPSVLLMFRHQWLPAVLVLIGLFTCAWMLQAQLADRYTDAKSTESVEVLGRIVGLPEVSARHTRFRLQTTDLSGVGARPDPLVQTDGVGRSGVAAGSPKKFPDELLVYWYRDAPELIPGQVWRLQVRLKPPWGLVNFQGHDRERWLFALGIGGQATVRQGELMAEPNGSAWLDRARLRLSQDITSLPSSSDSLGMVAALAVADRSSVSKEQNRSLSYTGTTHLLSISGLHIGLAYLCAFYLARLLLLPFGKWLQNGQRHCILAGWLLAFAYAALAGFSTETVRSLVMLSVVLMVFVARRCIHPMHSWMLALAVVLLIEPFALLQAGAWMSFVAVLALLLWFMPRQAHSGNYLQSSLQAQWAVMLICFPFTAWWFQMSSPGGFLANLLAIPWVSVVVVPLILLGLALWPFGTPAFEWLMNIAAHACDWMMWILDPMAQMTQDYSRLLQPSWPSLILAIVAAALLMLPRGLRLQAPSLLLLMPLLLPAEPVSAGKLQLDVLDVGQGTALLLQTGAKLLLYDSGPGDGAGNDLVDSVIVPAILASGNSAPDRIIISHGDLDHAGGLASVQRQYPQVPTFASLAEQVPGIEPCNDALAWDWLASEFRVLHPSAYLPYRGNDSSCVLDINVGQFKILLTGDISTKVERRLLSRKRDVYRILLVPHHGSKSSSDPELLHASTPQWAFATAGAGNRFGFPRPEVQQRYADAGIPLLSTDQCGAIRLQIEADDTVLLQSARRVRSAPWRWPAGADCP